MVTPCSLNIQHMADRKNRNCSQEAHKETVGGPLTLMESIQEVGTVFQKFLSERPVTVTLTIHV